MASGQLLMDGAKKIPELIDLAKKINRGVRPRYADGMSITQVRGGVAHLALPGWTLRMLLNVHVNTGAGTDVLGSLRAYAGW